MRRFHRVGVQDLCVTQNINGDTTPSPIAAGGHSGLIVVNLGSPLAGFYWFVESFAFATDQQTLGGGRFIGLSQQWAQIPTANYPTPQNLAVIGYDNPAGANPVFWPIGTSENWISSGKVEPGAVGALVSTTDILKLYFKIRNDSASAVNSWLAVYNVQILETDTTTPPGLPGA